jgi:hypothetical protein
MWVSKCKHHSTEYKPSPIFEPTCDKPKGDKEGLQISQPLTPSIRELNAYVLRAARKSGYGLLSFESRIDWKKKNLKSTNM